MEKQALTLVILNGKAPAMRRCAKRSLRCVRKAIRSRCASREQGDSERYLQEAVQLNAATVVAGGGDGTINELANALVKIPAAASGAGHSAARHRQRFCHQRGHS